MASETIDPIDWSHPPPSWAVPPERLRALYKSVQPLPGIDIATISMRGNNLAYAAAQGTAQLDMEHPCSAAEFLISTLDLNTIMISDFGLF